MVKFAACLFLILLPVSVLAESPVIRVAVFEGNGVGRSSKQLVANLESATDIPMQIAHITAAEIREGKLADFDVVVHPGGSGSKQGKALGESGREAVRKFVRNGGGYLGVCAGAYLATNDYDWSLNLIDAKVLDRRHWARGNGTVKLKLSPSAATFFNQPSREVSIYYGQGPLLARREWDDPDVPDYESLAVFASEIAKNNAPRGIMVGTSAAVRCEFSDGRVFCMSPHSEMTEGLDNMLPAAVRWLAVRKFDPKPKSTNDSLEEKDE